MSLYIVDIHGELEGDYEIIKKYEEPTTKNDLGVDCISRDDVRHVMQELWGMSGELMDRLMALPSVTPQFSSGLEKNSKKLEKDFGESDCISRADAIRVASGYCHPSNVAKELAKLPSVTSQEPRWIPVEERLPEMYEVVMTTRHGVIYPETRLTEDGWEWLYESGADYWEETDDIEAWMPLPEPYRAESEI